MSLLHREVPRSWSDELPVARTPLVDLAEGALVLTAGLMFVVLTLVSIFFN
jgi:hypothetical protein